MNTKTRDRRAALAEETLAILDAGRYDSPTGRVIDLHDAIAHCADGTRLYWAEEIADLPRTRADGAETAGTRIDVVNETTLAGLSALLDEGDSRVAVLNFASAKNPGGGFLGGSQAQEESLARSSALYASLKRCDAYYQHHRASPSLLYTDAAIFSPDCPVFRDDDGSLLEQPQCASFITCAAPNAGAIAQNHPDDLPEIASTFVRRIDGVLAVAAAHGCTRLVLGAWGCGVFRNDPGNVAQAFAAHLLHGAWRGRFERIRFSVLDTSRESATYAAFKRTFPSS